MICKPDASCHASSVTLRPRLLRDSSSPPPSPLVRFFLLSPSSSPLAAPQTKLLKTCRLLALRWPTPQVRTSMAVMPRHARHARHPRALLLGTTPWLDTHITVYRTIRPLSYVPLSFLCLCPRPPAPYASHTALAYIIPLPGQGQEGEALIRDPLSPFSIRLRAAALSHSLRPLRFPFARSRALEITASTLPLPLPLALSSSLRDCEPVSDIGVCQKVRLGSIS